MVQSAYEAAERLAQENKRLEENIAKMEELKAFEQLGGRATAGQQIKEESEEEKLKKQAQEFWGDL